MKKLSQRDVLIIVVAILFITAIAYVLFFVLPSMASAVGQKNEATAVPSQSAPNPASQTPALSSTEDQVVIYIGDKIYDIVPLKDDVITIDQGDGKINEITITPHGAHMSHSTCENQDCVQQGEATLENFDTRVLMGWVICLPNQVSIELRPKGTTP